LLLRMLTQDFGEWRHEPQRAASGAAMLALRTLAANSGAIGFHAMRQLAQALEMALRALRACAAPQLALDPAQRDVLEQVLQRSRRMLHDFALGDMPAGQGQLVAALQQLRAQLQAIPRPQPVGKPPADQSKVEKRSSEQPAAQDIAVAPPAPGALPRVALVRVRADILERIAAQAGAVSHAHARLEMDGVTLRAALRDFSENLIRLRRQLRDVELQAEAQIASRMAIAKAGEFDPLEFDRCARLQELTRIMAGSVADVAGVHQNLMRGVELANRHLQQQAGLTRALQSDLQSVRTLPMDGGAQARPSVRLRRHQAGAALPGALTIA
jgi:chemosensory pili system protein ChpA (sensor histidine kinase/response regulator)